MSNRLWWEDVKVNILPIFLNVGGVLQDADHHAFRSGQSTIALPETRDAIIRKRMKSLGVWLQHTNLLCPFVFERLSDLDKLKEELNSQVDLLLPIWVGGARWGIISTRLADLGKPILMIGFPYYGTPTLGIIAGLRAQGKEAYYSVNVADPALKDTLKTLRVKKLLRMTRIVGFPSGSLGQQEWHPGTILYDPRRIKEKLGVTIEHWPEWRLVNETKKIKTSESEKVVDEWLEKATEIREIWRKGEVKKKYLLPAAKIYLALKKLAGEWDVTAFSGCLSLGWVIDDIPTTPCIPYVWLKDEGIPCACENDIPAALTQIILMYLSGKPSDMGNPFFSFPAAENEPTSDFYNQFYHDKIEPPEKNTIVITHCVTPRKMDGFNKEGSHYMICGTFYSSDWLTPVTFTELQVGQDITIARLGPLTNRMLIAEGTIVGSVINPVGGVRNATYIKVQDALDLYHKCADVGHHLVYIYGRYGEELSELCGACGIEVLKQ